MTTTTKIVLGILAGALLVYGGYKLYQKSKAAAE